MHLPTEAIAGSPLGDYLAHENTLAAFAALATHLACQIVEPPALFVLIGYTLATFLGTWTLLQSGSYSLMAASVKIGKLEVVYSATLLASIGFYRLFLHRLSRFPGPKLAALSKLYYMKHVAGGHAPAHIEELHRRYGDVVRIGPNELSVREAESIAQILGYPGKMEKGPWYLGSFAKKGQSVHALRGLQEHAHRRKYWDRAFSPKALSEYQVQVKECTDLFIQRLEDASTKGTVQMDDWCTFVAFDIMGELGFGQSFGMLESGKPHFYQTFIESAMKALAIFSEIPWVMPVLTLLPAGKEQENMYKFSMQTTMDRKHRGTGRTDVFSYLVGEDKGAETAPMNDFELDADIRTIIIAGSDTTASTLSFIFSHLLEEPRWMKALQQEVEHFRGKDLDIQELAKLPILNAVIDETLRYNTIVPNRSQRIVPSEGKVLANQAIPGGAFISIPFRAIMHDERYFDDPERWNPDRLISPQSQKNLNSKCLIPFSFGPFNCAGRHLALLELRVIVAAFAIHFDGQLAPGFDKQKFEEHVLERFTIQKEYPLTANLTVRKPTK